VTILKAVTGLSAPTVFSLCAYSGKPSAAKGLRKQLLTYKALKLMVVDSGAWGWGKLY